MHLSLRLELVYGQAGRAEFVGEGHGKAARMGGSDQLFGIGACLVLEPSFEAEERLRQCTAFRRYRSLAVLEVAFPSCGCFSFHHVILLHFWIDLSLFSGDLPRHPNWRKTIRLKLNGAL